MQCLSPKKLSSCWPMRTRTLAYILLCVLVGQTTVISLPLAFGVVDWRAVAGSGVGVVSLINGVAWFFFLPGNGLGERCGRMERVFSPERQHLRN